MQWAVPIEDIKRVFASTKATIDDEADMMDDLLAEVMRYQIQVEARK